MNGINLNQPILYKFSSLRFFGENEHHVDRFCQDDVLLLVYDGILRFYEDGVPYEIHPGQYHIQKHNTLQAGPEASDSPKYLYVHFLAEWNADGTGLPRSGTFEYTKLKKDIDTLDTLAHRDAPYILQAGKFYDLLSQLYQVKSAETTVQSIADYIERELNRKITLDMLCEEFHFSKNHIINLFRKEFGKTPVAYMNHLRLQKAEYLIEVTSDTLESICEQCGFQNYSHFYKLFTRKNSLCPEQWREQKRLGCP